MLSDAQRIGGVYYSDLEFDDQLALRHGVPFTGIAFSVHYGGNVEFQGNYVEGLPDGLQEEWYSDGQLAGRAIAVRGRGSSESWRWHPNDVQAQCRRNVDQRPVEL